MKEVINENPNIITNEAIKTIITRKRGFFNDVIDLANIMKPIKEAILNLESSKATLADCYFYLAYLGRSISKIPEDDHVIFRQYAIKIFNERFKAYDFDEYLLAYYIHPGYKGKKLIFIKFFYINIFKKFNKINFKLRCWCKRNTISKNSSCSCTYLATNVKDS